MSISQNTATEPIRNAGGADRSPLARVLVIDDEEVVCDALSLGLKAEGFGAFIAHSGAEAVELLRGRQCELAIVDLVMPGMDGIETMAAVKKIDPDIEVIILTGYASAESTLAALRQGACDFLLKPVGLAEFRAAVIRALARRRPDKIVRENDRLRCELARTVEELNTLTRAVARAESRERAVVDAASYLTQRGEGLDKNLIAPVLELQPEVTAKDSHAVPIARLVAGMILDQEVRTAKGLLVAPKGQEVTAPLLLKLKSFLGKNAIADAVFVRRPEVS
jgi:DNA-binding response OmpR family regulator